ARMPRVMSSRAMPPGRTVTLMLPAALDVADQAPLLCDLALAEDVLLVLVRVVAFLEHEAHRRTDQLETLAEEILEVSRIRGRQRFQARAMHDEGRRVLAARVRETQLGRVPAHDRRRARLVG